MRILATLLVLCLPCMTNALEVLYRFKSDALLDSAEVKVCFVDEVPEALFNGAWRYNRWLKGSKGPDGEPLSVRHNRMYLSGVKPGQCIDYEVALDSGKGRRRSLYRSGKDVIFNNNMWLWQPRAISVKDKVTITFDLPQGFNVSAPWLDREGIEGEGMNGNNRNRFKLTTTPFRWDSRIAIGQFKVEKLRVGSQTLRVAILNSNPKRKAQYLDWIKETAEAIQTVNGRYPVNHPQIVVTPIGAKREAVPWGEVQRGGNVAAHFFVDSYRPIAEFKADWTAAHELSHMFVPFIDRDELYLSEGMASYYQYVARAKAGILSPEAAWDKLLAGFGRGMRSAKRELLANNPSTMQMYWGGAAIYLMADVQLRKQSGGRQNLGTVLHKFAMCCKPNTTSWSGLRLMRKYDELSGTKIFTTLYQEQAQERRFPDITPTLEALGFDSLKRNKRKPLSKAALDIMR